MERLGLLLCLMLAASQATVLDPRGARPVEHGTRSEKCATQKEWPFCTTDDWGPKCPSGCRIQGLMDANDHSLLKRIEKIRSLLEQHRAKHRSADLGSKQAYESIKEKLTLDSGLNNNYYDLAQRLRQRITDMKIKIDQQMLTLAALKDRVKDQVAEMQRLEVDIDIKLRSCKGSCAKYGEHQVDMDSYVTLDKQIQQLDAQSAQSVQSVGTLHVMKSRPLQAVVVETLHKAGDVGGSAAAAQQQVDVFTEVETMHLILEEEGSSSSPATISKVPGTSFSPSTSSSTSSTSSSSTSSSSASSKSITELSGGDLFGPGGFDSFGQPSTSHVTTKSVSCTKTVRRTVVTTASGPEERVEEVWSGGPECQAMTDAGQGGTAALFPTLTGGGAGGTKGLLGDTKAGIPNPFGSDLGAFLTDAADDDVPDFHARSVMSTRVERHADYVGTDCVAAFQHHLNGEKSGLFPIRPGGGGGAALQVYCHQEGLMGGWLLVQQRGGGGGGGLDFNRTWAEYRDGFGSVNASGEGELWIGNRNLHLLTRRGETLLRVEVEDWEGGVASAEYVASVGAEEDGFPLQVSGYAGDAGDALAPHGGTKFSTFDRDADGRAGANGAGWWYGGRQAANLNGAYRWPGGAARRAEGGVVWSTFRPTDYSLKAARMFLRPATL